MNYTVLKKLDCEDGIGIRLALYCSGCEIHCAGCHNYEAWDFNSGKPFTEDLLNDMIDELNKFMYTGFSLLGGEPFAEKNIDTNIHIIKTLKEHCPDRTFWVYSGYTVEHLLQNDKCRELLDLCDVLIDGPYLEQRRNVTLAFRGSDNQRIFDLRGDKPVELHLE